MKRRTGLKILYRKLEKYIKYPARYFIKTDYSFPKSPKSFKENIFNLNTFYNEIKSDHLEKTLGYLYNRPSDTSVRVWKKFLSLNPNNLGDFAYTDISRLTGARKAEHILVKKLVNLLGGDLDDWNGYATSGATEGNIFSAWAGKKYLEDSKKAKKICIVTNCMTHYSLRKAADVLGIENFEITINKDFKPDLENLRITASSLYKRGYTGILLPVTLGYTQTGLNDDIDQIQKIAHEIERDIPINFFIWADAAINGLVSPFLQKNFRPLFNNKIESIALDFHKTGMCPIPSGIVLYKRHLKNHIKRDVAYLAEPDATLLGSRSGITPIAMLSVVESLGIEGFKRILRSSVKRKGNFVGEVKREFPNLKIISATDGISCALVSKSALPKRFLNKYGLYAKKWKYNFTNGQEAFFIYKLNFLPKAS